MYLTSLKTLLVDAVKETFDEEYPEADFRDLEVSIEYPMKETDYPGIWVDFAPVGQLQIAGVGHIEYAEIDGQMAQVSRWRYQGRAQFTLVAMTSLERDRLFDEFIKVLAFGRENPAASQFRAKIENNEWIACNFDFDEIETGGFAATQGTPWGTDQVVYEGTISMECFGEFVGDWSTDTLVPLARVTFDEPVQLDYDTTTGQTTIPDPPPDPSEGWIT